MTPPRRTQRRSSRPKPGTVWRRPLAGRSAAAAGRFGVAAGLASFDRDAGSRAEPLAPDREAGVGSEPAFAPFAAACSAASPTRSSGSGFRAGLAADSSQPGSAPASLGPPAGSSPLALLLAGALPVSSPVIGSEATSAVARGGWGPDARAASGRPRRQRALGRRRGARPAGGGRRSGRGRGRRWSRRGEKPGPRASADREAEARGRGAPMRPRSSACLWLARAEVSGGLGKSKGTRGG